MKHGRLALVAVVLAAAALPAGCDDSDERSPPERERSSEQQRPQAGLQSPEGLMIRDWLMAVTRGDYALAATFFAPGAIIDQGRPFRLETRAAARLFNAGLPCHADLIALDDEGARVLATFRLKPGPGGPCEGRVQVRYTIVDGRFTEWRQLPGTQPEPPGPVV
jgi:hypothetical protein